MTEVIMELLQLVDDIFLQTNADGVIRLGFKQLCCIPLEHVSSGLKVVPDNQLQSVPAGYTQWTYPHDQRLSIAWDWQWIWKHNHLQMEMLGMPRSNIQLQHNGVDLSPRYNEILLSQFVERYIDWQPCTTRAMALRYTS